MEKRGSSILGEVYTRFSNLPHEFKTAVCKECLYSESTFYRKLNTFVSRAEKQMVVSIAEDLLLELQEVLNRYK